ncbi:tetratricopeptide repeat protein [Gynuella sunshinyii]|uniref:Cytochrome c biogenesis factor n=1 Tax=Gynuella sunshinyii YC6258 TaxID=1445510 RepID=A0A0C5VDZ8_9GAMM|nr:hypothetical protein [Gynuella sunshinyii]AJQ92732.1 cytochrome c biogenesis factor [Gynuella sunshinyii YC6258]
MVDMRSESDQLDETEYKHLIAYYIDKNDSSEALKLTKQSLLSHPDSAELKYLGGTVYADIGMYDKAKELLTDAIDTLKSPEPAVFQLGLLYLTSGQIEQAGQIWQRLSSLPENHFLRCFVDGLTAMVRDRFDAAQVAIEQGISTNTELPALNIDMEKVLIQIAQITDNNAAAESSHILLSRYDSQKPS